MAAGQYDWWRKAIKLNGGYRELTRDQLRDLGISEGHPESGFFRMRRHKDGPFVPVAIWRDKANALNCWIENTASDGEKVWSFCCRHPVSEEIYRAALKGEPWPDDLPKGAPAAATSDEQPRPNVPEKTGDSLTDLAAEFKAERELAEAFLAKPIKTQEQADQAAIWSKKLKGISTKADTYRKAEKEPHATAAAAVDDKWRDLVNEPAALSTKLKRHLDAFLEEQKRIERERVRLAEIEAARKRREAEEAAAAAERERIERERRRTEAPSIVETFGREIEAEEKTEAEKRAEDLAKQAAQAEKDAQERSVSAGRTGAKVSQRKFYEARVTNYDALIIALKAEPEIREAALKIANRIAKTEGATMPAGSERIEDTRAV